jgi:hypothetical protein
MMPLITRKSSTRATPRTLFGSNGRSRSNCSLLNQNSLKSRLLLLPSLNHIRVAKGIQFMVLTLESRVEAFHDHQIDYRGVLPELSYLLILLRVISR